MDLTLILFYCLLLLVAFLYASVGHGGASGYLALMALFGVAPAVMKPTALVLNLFVSAVSFIQFYRARHFKKEICWPLIVASIPMAYIGGRITLDADIYKKILGVVLLISVVRFLMPGSTAAGKLRPANRTWLFIIGGLIGLLSGMIGIGGGIILSPILLLLRWADVKQSAALSAVFIFVNSLAGLLGQLSKSVSFTPSMYAYVGIALVGGLAGAYFGAKHFKNSVLKYILAGVLLLAVFKLIFTTA
ncbi:sulfite exporter TauE/SafE family protein [Pseudoflavitalea sp. X16]|uniref:sulfite exporter TauE/SafE family protein n=1 Tax=Paraflavitalea devenefica TaxID=2716334 RepID=UPI00142013B8|nr:sulfite exporter TauE/SafE family protein [Paraflavitalea devenefica]NII28533.1 sulfite exporter TauE/SafE family protein [Paraflavitalea devenefica]